MVEGFPVPARLNRARARVVVLAILAVLAVSPAWAAPRRDDGAFQARFDAGIALYQKGEYKAAAVELAAAHDLEPRADVAFALAQALRKAGDCREAMIYYREVLAGDISVERREAVEEAMAPCARVGERRTLAGNEAPPPASDHATAAPDRRVWVPATVPEREPAPRWYRDPLGDGLVIAGVAGLGLGVAGLAVSGGRYRSAEDAGSESAFADAIAAGDRWKRIGMISLAAGGALVLGGVVRWVVVAGRDGEERLALIPDPRGGLMIAGEL